MKKSSHGSNCWIKDKLSLLRKKTSIRSYQWIKKKSPSLYLYGLHGFTEIGDNGDDAEEAPYIGASNGEIQWFRRSEALFSSFKKVKEARLRTRSWPSMAEQQFKLEEE